MRMIGHFDTTCCGIPCQVHIDTYTKPNCYADSDWDFYGCLEWTLLDRKGYPADWLYNKASASQIDLINAQAHEYVLRNKDED